MGPSPLNAVKLDLGVILVLGFLVFLVHRHLSGDVGGQFLVLICYGFAGMIWLIIRTRRVLRRAANDQEPQ